MKAIVEELTYRVGMSIGMMQHHPHWPFPPSLKLCLWVEDCKSMSGSMLGVYVQSH